MTYNDMQMFGYPCYSAYLVSRGCSDAERQRANYVSNVSVKIGVIYILFVLYD